MSNRSIYRMTAEMTYRIHADISSFMYAQLIEYLSTRDSNVILIQTSRCFRHCNELSALHNYSHVFLRDYLKTYRFCTSLKSSSEHVYCVNENSRWVWIFFQSE